MKSTYEADQTYLYAIVLNHLAVIGRCDDDHPTDIVLLFEQFGGLVHHDLAGRAPASLSDVVERLKDGADRGRGDGLGLLGVVLEVLSEVRL
jgi:hypothetical protein